MADPSVRSTLLWSLFTRPRPIDPKAFERARPEMFPRPDAFVAFLRSESEQDMARRAREILLSLLFDSTLTPSSKLLLNLSASQQDRLSVVKQGDYVPQDHFVHLVNLYLLGLYLFSYHEGFHRRGTSELARELRKCDSGGALEGYEMFASAWKQFVLFHDIAYPLERVLPKDRARGKELHPWLSSFEDIRSCLISDLATKALARCIVTQSLLTQTDPITFGEVFLRRIDLGTASATKLAGSGDPMDWQFAVGLPNINGPEDLRTVLSVVPDLRFCAFLESARGKHEIAVFGPVSSCQYWSPSTEVPAPWRSVIKNVSASDALLSTKWGRGLRGQRWHYFALEPEQSMRKAIDRMFGAARSADFEVAWRAVEGAEAYAEEKATRADNARTLGAIAFNDIFRRRGNFSQFEETGGRASAIDRMLTTVQEQRSTAVESLPHLVSQSVLRTLKKLLKANRDQLLGKVKTSGSRAAASQVYELLQQEKKTLVNEISADLHDAITKPLEADAAIRKCTESLTARLSPVVSGVKELFVRSEVKLPSFGVHRCLERLDTPTTDVDKRLGELGLPTLAALGGSYRAAWMVGADGESFVDHGLAAAALALHANAVILSVKERHLTLFSVACGLRSDSELDRVELDAHWLRGVVTESIALHNLYPKDISGHETHRTDLSVRPFSFLALFADGLQRWDRRCLVDEARGEGSSPTPGGRFDVAVRDGRVRIRMSAERLSLARTEQDLRTSLASYLLNGRSLISLELRELG